MESRQSRAAGGRCEAEGDRRRGACVHSTAQLPRPELAGTRKPCPLPSPRLREQRGPGTALPRPPRRACSPVPAACLGSSPGSSRTLTARTRPRWQVCWSFSFKSTKRGQGVRPWLPGFGYGIPWEISTQPGRAEPGTGRGCPAPPAMWQRPVAAPGECPVPGGGEQRPAGVPCATWKAVQVLTSRERVREAFVGAGTGV